MPALGPATNQLLVGAVAVEGFAPLALLLAEETLVRRRRRTVAGPIGPGQPGQLTLRRPTSAV